MGRFDALVISFALPFRVFGAYIALAGATFRTFGAMPQGVSAPLGFLILVLARFVFGC